MIAEEDIPLKRALGCMTILGLLFGIPFACYRIACVLWPARWSILALLAIVEWCFYIFWYRRTYNMLNKIPRKCQPENFSSKEAQQNWDRFIKLTSSIPGGVDPVPYLSQWFCNAKFEDIKRGNVEEMLVYGFYYKHRDEMTGELAHIPGQMVDQLEQGLNVKFTPGYTSDLPFMSHLWEDLRAHYRPLLLYLGFEMLYAAQRLIMASYGFKHKALGLLGYYTLNCGIDHISMPVPRSAPENEHDDEWTPFAAPLTPKSPMANPLNDAVPQKDKATPVMFLHGVGGLMLYLEMLKHVIALEHPVIVIEYKHVAMRLSAYIPTVDEVTENVVKILDYEQIPKVCVVGHSYGSFMGSRLNALHKERLHSICLIDPVCIGMFMPHLLHNFMYRRPRIDWRHPDVLVRDLALWFASRDLHIAATFARRFYWSDLNLWPEDLPPGSCVVLSGNDDLCHAEEIVKMLEMAGHVRVILNPHLFHGAFLLDPRSKANLMVEVKALLATSGSLVVRLARPVVDRTLSAARSLLHDVETLTARLSHTSLPGSPRNLRRTVTDIRPGKRAWQRSGSFGEGRRSPPDYSKSNSPATSAAVDAADRASNFNTGRRSVMRSLTSIGGYLTHRRSPPPTTFAQASATTTADSREPVQASLGKLPPEADQDCSARSSLDQQQQQQPAIVREEPIAGEPAGAAVDNGSSLGADGGRHRCKLATIQSMSDSHPGSASTGSNKSSQEVPAEALQQAGLVSSSNESSADADVVAGKVAVHCKDSPERDAAARADGARTSHGFDQNHGVEAVGSGQPATEDTTQQVEKVSSWGPDTDVNANSSDSRQDCSKRLAGPLRQKIMQSKAAMVQPEAPVGFLGDLDICQQDQQGVGLLQPAQQLPPAALEQQLEQEAEILQQLLKQRRQQQALPASMPETQ